MNILQNVCADTYSLRCSYSSILPFHCRCHYALHEKKKNIFFSLFQIMIVFFLIILMCYLQERRIFNKYLTQK